MLFFYVLSMFCSFLFFSVFLIFIVTNNIASHFFLFFFSVFAQVVIYIIFYFRLFYFSSFLLFFDLLVSLFFFFIIFFLQCYHYALSSQSLMLPSWLLLLLPSSSPPPLRPLRYSRGSSSITLPSCLMFSIGCCILFISLRCLPHWNHFAIPKRSLTLLLLQLSLLASPQQQLPLISNSSGPIVWYSQQRRAPRPRAVLKGSAGLEEHWGREHVNLCGNISFGLNWYIRSWWDYKPKQNTCY